jgi:hypothetical protein
MNTKSKREAQRERLKKLDAVTEAWQASEYSAVIAPFRDNKEHFQFIGHALIQLRRLESDVISDLMEIDDGVEDDDIQSCVVEHLVQWTETIDRMVRILEASRDRAWEVLNEIDGVSAEESSGVGGSK